MPFVKRKAVDPLPVPAALVDAQAAGQNPAVFFLAATGEVFVDYECVARALTQGVHRAAGLLPPAHLPERAERQGQSDVF